MTTFAAAPASTLEARAPDPTKHVNYTLGMLLGVDDFNQEYAYLIGRDRWLARDAVGYGTLNGLRVTVDQDAAKGPRITVSSGSALTPRGQLVCVKPAQCAFVNEWLAANPADIATALGSPLSSTLPLYVTLCYRDCPVDLVPIPGEPCRTEDELMKPSRLIDDFTLALRTTPPDQSEEDLLREFVIWLRMLAFGGGGPYATVEDLEDALRASVQEIGSPPASPIASPVSSPLAGAGIHITFGSPPASLKLDPQMAAEYFRAAWRVWTTEIRPRVHRLCCGGGGCCGDHGEKAPKPEECLLLARIDVPILMSAGKWVADDTKKPDLDESRRPMLLHLRLLQELLASGTSNGGGGALSPIVAAGIVGPGGARSPVRGGLAAAKVNEAELLLTFPAYQQPGGATPVQWVVQALPLASAGMTNPLVAVEAFTAAGIVLRIVRGSNGQPFPAGTIDTMELSVGVTRVG
ncbi:MAG: hypothetical protein ABR517_03630 [Thermoanaerobaculia bacterium]